MQFFTFFFLFRADAKQKKLCTVYRLPQLITPSSMLYVSHTTVSFLVARSGFGELQSVCVLLRETVSADLLSRNKNCTCKRQRSNLTDMRPVKFWDWQTNNQITSHCSLLEMLTPTSRREMKDAGSMIYEPADGLWHSLFFKVYRFQTRPIDTEKCRSWWLAVSILSQSLTKAARRTYVRSKKSKRSRVPEEFSLY